MWPQRLCPPWIQPLCSRPLWVAQRHMNDYCHIIEQVLGSDYNSCSVTLQEILGVEALSSCIFAPKAKIIALTWPLHLSEGKKVNVYTDSKYGFSVVNIHSVIWKERVLTFERKEIKHVKEILKLLDTVLKPKEVVICSLPKTSEIWLFCFEKEQHSRPSLQDSLQDKAPLVIALLI